MWMANGLSSATLTATDQIFTSQLLENLTGVSSDNRKAAARTEGRVQHKYAYKVKWHCGIEAVYYF